MVLLERFVVISITFPRILLFGLSLLSSLVAAFLLFLVEPMIARLLLPQFGGGPTVWTTCLLFFQVILLVSYWYVHLLTRMLSLRAGAMIHSALICLSVASSTLEVNQPTLTLAYPGFQLLYSLATTIGLPFFVLGSSAPLIQYWFQAATGLQPYFLYAASNCGSALAVIAYPLLVEPRLRLDTQFFSWGFSYSLLLSFFLLYGFVIIVTKPSQQEHAKGKTSSIRLSFSTRGRWFFLSFFPSSLLLGVTHYITAHVAPIPLLWMIPLFIYLATYVWAFARQSLKRFDLLLRIYIILVLGVILGIWLEVGSPFILFFLLHLSTFFAACMLCHSALAIERPQPSLLTSYYGWIALGGAGGAVLNALLAPLLLTTYLEYPLALLGILLCFNQVKFVSLRLACRDILSSIALPSVLSIVLCVPLYFVREPVVVLLGCLIVVYAFSVRDNLLRFLVVSASFLITGLWYHGDFGVLLKRDRNFFGQLRVGETTSGDLRTFVHGSTIHGSQFLDADRRCTSLDYYWPGGPAGTFITTYQNTFGPRTIGLLGLGAGSLLSYRRPHERWIALEIDQNVVDVARQYFSYRG
jgi:hypothetical protein